MAGMQSLDPAEWIGRTVEVAIDRPLGSVHPRDPRCVYGVNYGFVPGTRAGDGHPIDAYVLGPDEPAEAVRAEIVAVIARADDVEDKLVVATASSGTWSATDIAVAVEFQERWFDATVFAVGEDALKISALRRAVRAVVVDRVGRVLLVQYHDDDGRHWWVVPGGGIGAGEERRDALRRELKEEVGLDCADLGPCRWLRSCCYGHEGRVVHQAEWIYAVEVDAPTVDLDAPGARAEGITAVRWWGAAELASATETIYPPMLSDLVREERTAGPPRLIRG